MQSGSGGAERVLGLAASPGRVLGELRRVEWNVAAPRHRTIAETEIPVEVLRFDEARLASIERIEELRETTRRKLGEIEAKIFDPQLMMLQDPDLVEGTTRYIRENFLAAERAFDWRITELRTQILDAAHLMIVDRLADLMDVRYRVLTHLLGRAADPTQLPNERAILVFDDLTPSLAVRLDPSIAVGLVIGAGSRTAHSAVLARSMGIPAVVGLGKEIARLEEGAMAIMDGGSGKIIVRPTTREVAAHVEVERRLSEVRDQLSDRPAGPVTTHDGVRVALRANLDQPHDAAAAQRVAAEGVGLFRSEFLVIGQRVIPSEKEQYEAYSSVVESFPDHPVTLRTFDIGGDKFPLFLDMPPEENPYLGWRAIRVCLDLPDLFRNQIRAAVRAGGDQGRLRILIPFVTSLDEVLATRKIVNDVAEGVGVDPASVPLGIMVETPAVVETLDLIAEHIDFVSLGTNDLSQYTLAVDRGNARLAHLSDALHPAMLRLYARVFEQASSSGLEIAVCGDLATDPTGLAVLLGIGYRDFSIAPVSFPEIREFVGTVSAGELAGLCANLGEADRVSRVKDDVIAYLDATIPPDMRGLSE
ncbi:MAG: phosphoenolpyruvate--protein phosphotransferase [Gemmatimonadota bacterium]|nr:phosphoenolpyruvate--protein phosphotransferase [Gemmatimonadota bacterium]